MEEVTRWFEVVRGGNAVEFDFAFALWRGHRSRMVQGVRRRGLIEKIPAVVCYRDKIK